MATLKPNFRLDVLSYGKLAANKHGYVAGQVEVTSKCFQHCIACESWRDDKKGVIVGEWTLKQLQDFCEWCANFGIFEHLSLTGGDPQAWPFLEEFLEWFQNWRPMAARSTGSWIRLQLNTALVKPVTNPELWRTAIDDVRISLDTLNTKIYQQIRGDRQTTPKDILKNADALRHPRLAINTTIYPENIGVIRELIDGLADVKKYSGLPIRKVMFLAVIGPRRGDLNEGYFWQTYKELKAYSQEAQVKEAIETGFAEDVKEVRDFCKSEEAKSIPCYAGNLSFHAKANGDLYPCCLAGGEAITTYPQLKLGNLWERLTEQEHPVQTNPLRQLYDKYQPGKHYGKASMPCSDICQWKQLQVNLAAHLAASTVLSMP